MNKKCRFGEFCSFEHEIEGMALKQNKEDKIKNLEKVIEAKNLEIERLRSILKDPKIFQLDGEVDNDSETTTNDDSDFLDTEDDINNEEVFQCDTCDFLTKHKNGLKIHVARIHNFKCDQCEVTFKNGECLERHK